MVSFRWERKALAGTKAFSLATGSQRMLSSRLTASMLPMMLASGINVCVLTDSPSVVFRHAVPTHRSRAQATPQFLRCATRCDRAAITCLNVTRLISRLPGWKWLHHQKLYVWAVSTLEPKPPDSCVPDVPGVTNMSWILKGFYKTR